MMHPCPMSKTLTYINSFFIFVICSFALWFYFFEYNTSNKTLNQPEKQVEKEDVVTSDEDSKNEDFIQECEKLIDERLAAIPSPIAVEKTTPKPQISLKNTVYLPIDGPFGSTSTDWYDLSGTEFYLDFERDYGENAYATWDVQLKVDHGNGATYARLYDVTNKVAVNGSEVSILGNRDYTEVNSGQLFFWRGRNQYRVQIKSLNGYEAGFGSARIKIRY